MTRVAAPASLVDALEDEPPQDPAVAFTSVRLAP
jgi:hypothetical protein